MNRRKFLGISAVATVGLAAGGYAIYRNYQPNNDWIDAHVHVWTDNFEAYPISSDFTPADMNPKTFTPDELFVQCCPQGVNRIVLIQMSYYRTDNSYMLDVIRNHPGVFRGVAIVDENAPDVTETMEDLVRQGVRGFRVYATRENAALWQDSQAMHRIWEFGAENNVAICCLSDPEALPDIYRLCERFPGTPVVIDHFSRIGMRGPVNDDDLNNLLRLNDFDKTYVKLSAFYALGEKKAPYTDLIPMIRRVYDTFGPARLMWASDCPFQVAEGHTYENSIALIRDRIDFFSSEDKEWILKKTAEQVYFS